MGAHPRLVRSWRASELNALSCRETTHAPRVTHTRPPTSALRRGCPLCPPCPRSLSASRPESARVGTPPRSPAPLTRASITHVSRLHRIARAWWRYHFALSSCRRSCGPCPRGCLVVVVLVVCPAQCVHPLFPAAARQRGSAVVWELRNTFRVVFLQPSPTDALTKLVWSSAPEPLAPPDPPHDGAELGEGRIRRRRRCSARCWRCGSGCWGRSIPTR